MRLVGLLLQAILVLLLFHTCTEKPSGRQEQSIETVKVPDSVLLKTADSLFLIGEKYDSNHVKDSALIFYLQSLTTRESISSNDTALINNQLKIAALYLEQFKYD